MREADARSKKRPDNRDSGRICRSRRSNCYPLQRLRRGQPFAGSRQCEDEHCRGGVQGRRNRDSIRATGQPASILSGAKIAYRAQTALCHHRPCRPRPRFAFVSSDETMIGLQAYNCSKGQLLFKKALKLSMSLVALATSLASLFAASWVGLALLGY